jgi:cytochrome c peroxidase
VSPARARSIGIASAAAGVVSVALLGAACSPSSSSMTKEQLGRAVFFDQGLSQPAGQSCADCHAPDRAFADPEVDESTSAGAVPGRFGPRNAPTAMYARFVPPLHLDPAGQQFVGGLFWDGRADTLEDQASNPFLNPLEMNNPDKATVVAAVRAASYAGAVRSVYGPSSLDDPEQAFANLLDAIATYERSQALSPFSSKYDRYLAGTATMTEQQLRGLAIFEDPARGNCASCHPSRPASDGTPPLFTDFTYANLGIPKYRNSRYLVQPSALNPDGSAFVDHGLMKTVDDARQDGKFRVPTLRNVARTGPYGHNGYFGNLEYILDFHNTRDVGSSDVGPWAPPEVAANVDARVGHLGLSTEDVYDVLSFLQTLTDAAP